MESPFENKAIAFAALVAEPPEFSLSAAEEVAIAGSKSPKRLKEFRLGRAAAHSALAQLGLQGPFYIGKGASREPLWPEGICGSITHCGPYAAAAAAKSTDIRGIGIDLEFLGAARRDLSEQLGGSDEVIWMRQDPSLERMLFLFAAKEACYKLLFPLVRKYVGFKDVACTWIEEQQGFEAKLLRNLAADLQEGWTVPVGISRSESYILAHAIILP